MSAWKNDYQHIRVDNLYLDLKNPRTDSGEQLSEIDVIKELLDENVLELADDIVQNGYAPVSVFMVVNEDGKFVVVDGNRRLMALKLINNPELIEGLASARASAKAKELHNTEHEDLTTATSIIYPDRKEAERDMAKLHLAGIAIQQWRLIRQYRYFQKRLEQDELSIESLAELLALDNGSVKKGIKTYQLYQVAKDRLSDIVEDIGQEIFADKNFKTDKFQRAIVNGEGERFLGYSFSDASQTIEVAEERIFLERLRLILLEIYDSDSAFFSSAQFTAKDRLSFFRTVDPSFLSDPDFKKAEKIRRQARENGQTNFFDEGATSTPEATKERLASETAPVKPTSPPADKSPSGRSVKEPKGLFWPSKIPYRLNNSSLKKIYDELRDLDVTQFPNAAHDLLRSFLECSLVEYLSASGEYAKIKKNQAHTPKLSELLDHVINNRLVDDDHVLENLKQLRADWNKPYSLQLMNHVNHNKNYTSSPSEVRAAWGKLEDLFRVILVPKP